MFKREPHNPSPTTMTTCSIAEHQIPLVKHFQLASAKIDAAISLTNGMILGHVRKEFFNLKPIFFRFSSDLLMPMRADKVANSFGLTTLPTEYLKMTS